jgi:DNA-binding HxlR family transcriptional regulator
MPALGVRLMTMTRAPDDAPVRGAADPAADPAAPANPGPSPGSVRGSSRGAARRSSCSLACALEIVGDRWTLLVVRDLIGGKRRYGDFLRSSERIPTNILADRLRLLEREGLIASVPYSERPRRLEYHLTPAGQALGRVVDALATWGLEHIPGTTRKVWLGMMQPVAAPGSPADPTAEPTGPGA